LPTIVPIATKWLRLLAPDTTLYGIGLFTNLHQAKGLSVGVKFYPSLPLIQVLRGEVGQALYTEASTPLRSEEAFHTMLTHSTGFRARNLTFPMSAKFVEQFQAIVEGYDNILFGRIGNIKLEDIYVRNGKSDKLITFAEVALSEYR
jgi:hypothetical protein